MFLTERYEGSDDDDPKVDTGKGSEDTLPCGYFQGRWYTEGEGIIYVGQTKVHSLLSLSSEDQVEGEVSLSSLHGADNSWRERNFCKTELN